MRAKAKHALIHTGSFGRRDPSVAVWVRAWGQCRCGVVYRQQRLSDVRSAHRIHLDEIRTGEVL